MKGMKKMSKYFMFAKASFKEIFSEATNVFGTVLSFVIHIIVFSFLWEFVLEGKTLAGYSRQELIWYVIMAEAICYSFHNFYKKVASKVENGDFAYDMTKPFNFMLRTIAEGVAELPQTVILIIAGGILGIITCGVLTTNILHIALSLVVMLLSTVILLLLNIIVGLLSMWLGRDVSSIWLLCNKAMLIFAFTPVELFPKVAQNILLALPTTHVIYTPASLFVHFSTNKFVVSMLYVIASIALLSIILYVIYRKGVKKQNVNGI